MWFCGEEGTESCRSLTARDKVEDSEEGSTRGKGVADPGTRPSSLLTSGVWWASHRFWDSSEEAVCVGFWSEEGSRVLQESHCTGQGRGQ